MAKKLIFVIINFILFEPSLIFCIINTEDDWLNENSWLSFFLLTFIFVLLSLCFLFPRVAFRISHWYVDKDLEDCNDVYSFFYPVFPCLTIIGMTMFFFLPILYALPYLI